MLQSKSHLVRVIRSALLWGSLFFLLSMLLLLVAFEKRAGQESRLVRGEVLKKTVCAWRIDREGNVVLLERGAVCP